MSQLNNGFHCKEEERRRKKKRKVFFFTVGIGDFFVAINFECYFFNKLDQHLTASYFLILCFFQQSCVGYDHKAACQREPSEDKKLKHEINKKLRRRKQLAKIQMERKSLIGDDDQAGWKKKAKGSLQPAQVSSLCENKKGQGYVQDSWNPLG